MLEKYRATIHGNVVEWDGEEPNDLKNRGEITVDVTVISKKARLKKPNGKKMAEALAKLAESGAAKKFGNPLKWQREVRKDRPLPGRS